VQERDVGYAGPKDRYAVTRQWFSIYLPKGETPDLTGLQHPEFKVLGQSRHVKKLRPGDLQGNRFRIVLRDVTGDRGAIAPFFSTSSQRCSPSPEGDCSGSSVTMKSSLRSFSVALAPLGG
jgi:tRNA pseudouridine13 synthase